MKSRTSLKLFYPKHGSKKQLLFQQRKDSKVAKMAFLTFFFRETGEIVARFSIKIQSAKGNISIIT